MELIKLTDKTYYIKNPTNIGVYKINDNEVYIIDSGNDKEAGKKIIKLLTEQNLTIKGIISTHSNADHIGGNKVIQDRLDVPIFAHKIEKCISENPSLEPSILYGGYPFKDLRNKFLMAEPSIVQELDDNLPEPLEAFPIKGHFFDMTGIKTDDDVYFIGDSIFSKSTIEKYHVFFIYDVREYLNTLDYLSTLKGTFVASHAEVTNDIMSLIELNRNTIKDISDYIVSILKEGMTFEIVLKNIFDHYNLVMNASQYVLVGSTIRSYLSYLYEENLITFEFENNQMLWKTCAA